MNLARHYSSAANLNPLLTIPTALSVCTQFKHFRFLKSKYKLETVGT